MTLSTLLWVLLLTLTPTLELRASIPYALLVAKWPASSAAAVGIFANFMLAPLVWVFVDRFLHLFLRIPIAKRIHDRIVGRKAEALRQKVDRWGVLGLAMFIGVPLPGTGVYSGCLAASLLGLRFRDYMVGSFLGCLMAGVIVTAVVASGNEAFGFLYKHSSH